MNIRQEPLPGVKFVELTRFEDARGTFVKTYSRSRFVELDIDTDFQEEFFSTSNACVIRGMHFQMPPYDHVKLVQCTFGRVLDVLLDLRKGPQYGQVASIELDARKPALLLIPKGIAHGFCSLEHGSLMMYKTSTEHKPSHDRGIRWDSFGFQWPVREPVVSVRDRDHLAFSDFQSTF
jgi:dTDP-4-dehydrorhamnose 3,5-epimerase/CDP-3, 6-dideoxy-D-glycero-D-glycero-4-hexulose-5-epimerase